MVEIAAAGAPARALLPAAQLGVPLVQSQEVARDGRAGKVARGPARGGAKQAAGRAYFA